MCWFINWVQFCFRMLSAVLPSRMLRLADVVSNARARQQVLHVIIGSLIYRYGLFSLPNLIAITLHRLFKFRLLQILCRYLLQRRFFKIFIIIISTFNFFSSDIVQNLDFIIKTKFWIRSFIEMWWNMISSPKTLFRRCFLSSLWWSFASGILRRFRVRGQSLLLYLDNSRSSHCLSSRIAYRTLSGRWWLFILFRSWKLGGSQVILGVWNVLQIIIT